MLCRSFSLFAAGFLYFVTVASPTEQDVAPTTNFNVLTMNVAGLPASYDPCGAPDNDKEMNTMYIGKILSQYKYGIINVQEDVRYHATLYAYDQHQYRTINTGDIKVSSGLNTLSDFSFVGFSSKTWDDCNSASKHDFDCNARKGFTFMRVRMEEGVYIDMINLHNNAGTGPHDYNMRCWNIEQVIDFIHTHSTGNAVIVFGNTNSLYTRPIDCVRRFTTQSGLKDAWVQSIGGILPVPGDVNTYRREVVNKVFYRGSAVINLNSTGFFYDTSRFLSPEGNLLMNHDPVRVEFGYSLTDGLRQSNLFGGPGGYWFNDLLSLPAAPKLASITLRGGHRLDGLTFSLTGQDQSKYEFKHGGTGGDPHSISLDSDEHIVSVKICWGKKKVHTTRIFFAKMTTSKGRIIQAGKETENCDFAFAPAGYGVVGAYGQDGKEMDQLGFGWVSHCSLLQGRLAAKEDQTREKRGRTGQERLMGDGLPRALSHGEFYEERAHRSQIAVAEEIERQRKATENTRIKDMKEKWKLAETARKKQNADAMRMPRLKPPPKLPSPPKPWLYASEQAEDIEANDRTGHKVNQIVEDEDKDGESEEESDSQLDEE